MVGIDSYPLYDREWLGNKRKIRGNLGIIRDASDAVRAMLIEQGFSGKEAAAISEVCFLDADERSEFTPKSTLTNAKANALVWSFSMRNVPTEGPSSADVESETLEILWQRIFPDESRIEDKPSKMDGCSFDLDDFRDDELETPEIKEDPYTELASEMMKNLGVPPEGIKDRLWRRKHMSNICEALFPVTPPADNPFDILELGCWLTISEEHEVIPGTIFLSGEHVAFFPETFLSGPQLSGTPFPMHIVDKCSHMAIMLPGEEPERGFKDSIEVHVMETLTLPVWRLTYSGLEISFLIEASSRLMLSFAEKISPLYERAVAQQ